MHLVESDQRKAQFLREAARATAAPVVVHPVRVEQLELRADVVTARALAPLPRLLDCLRETAPDIVCLQEIKTDDTKFPAAALERALTNLLDNAAKWSPPSGTVTVSLHAGTITVDDELVFTVDFDNPIWQLLQP